jgi:hypothetical protein
MQHLWLPRLQSACPSDPRDAPCLQYAAVEELCCCAVLCCAVLCCAVLCCAVLCCAVLCCAVLCSTVPCCAVLYYTVCVVRMV